MNKSEMIELLRELQDLLGRLETATSLREAGRTPAPTASAGPVVRFQRQATEWRYLCIVRTDAPDPEAFVRSVFRDVPGLQIRGVRKSTIKQEALVKAYADETTEVLCPDGVARWLFWPITEAQLRRPCHRLVLRGFA